MYRHRIHEYFSEEDLIKINKILQNPLFTNNNQRLESIMEALVHLDPTLIASGTNRMAIILDEYIYKIALDSRGIRDNWNEFNVSPKAQPYVTKTYECNGLIAVAEYVNVMSKEIFGPSLDHIGAMLEVLAEDWLFCDMALIPKNFTNFGFRDNDEIVVLDYGYLYPIDRRIMHCIKCGSDLHWNKDFSWLICDRCRRKHDPIEIRNRMWRSEDDFKMEEELRKKTAEARKKGKPLITLDLGPAFRGNPHEGRFM